MIAEAAHELGLEGLTLRGVADHLGVSIAALYHHVSSKDDLMRVAAEYSAERVPKPHDRGQHWAVWLYEWAAYNREVFVAQPGLLAQYLDGAISVEVIAGNVDEILGALRGRGFSVLEANEAYELVTACALGTAVGTMRERETAGPAGMAADLRRLLADRGAGELVHLRELVEAVRTGGGRPPFADRIATVLCGLAVRRGEAWEPIAAAIAALSEPPAEHPAP
jgi:AcrR family transcriptional regulator